MISPWSDTASLISPDGRTTASIEDAGEIAMGAPTSGTLILSTGLTVERCSPSMVWSDDSRYLAVPRWNLDRRQQLVIIDAREGAVRALPEIYRVLQLESFDGGIVRGVDSPIHRTQPVAIAIN
ncbi:hypothetical protein [Longimicrobium terrae]|uniref:Uncharacterized protein n=1 Tax=Longimicrobium terrae TaxID=1639882 RepID=A0A841H5L2_9BACT|nr:hypothetical protein [Longimicrobium terrae]MBB4638983.1 hypothetical protein [Longimicrobium terrae]MBB6073222.1 hypothetical protein [Longimicrobium terrae]NNC32327.1 hypothetical protein [Longimicrobium terrae]